MRILLPGIVRLAGDDRFGERAIARDRACTVAGDVLLRLGSSETAKGFVASGAIAGSACGNQISGLVASPV